MAKRTKHYRKVIVHMLDEFPTAIIGRMMMEMGEGKSIKRWLTPEGLVEMNREADENNVSYNVRIVASRKSYERRKKTNPVHREALLREAEGKTAMENRQRPGV